MSPYPTLVVRQFRLNYVPINFSVGSLYFSSTRRTKAMNARHFVKMWAAVLLLSPALVFSQLQPLDPGIRRLPALPDLVADVALGADCRIMVMVKNNGPGIVPDAGYSLSAPGSSG